MKRLLLIPALLLSSHGVAELYKWTDADGRVQFSDRKPEHGSHVEKMATPVVPPSSGSGRAEKSGSSDNMTERQKKISDVLRTEREQREAEAGRMAEQKARQKHRCLALLDYKKSTEGVRLYDLDDKGERKFMDEKARENHLSALDAEIKTACQP
ncbi:MAG: DUF4124 domain-containing protein [bacterium]|nr:DUF4124 domain-containing protein [bacterium]